MYVRIEWTHIKVKDTMKQEEMSKKQIHYVTTTTLKCDTCKVLTLAFGKLTTGSCMCCDSLLPVEPRNKYFSTHSMCLLRDLSPYDSMVGIVR